MRVAHGLMHPASMRPGNYTRGDKHTTNMVADSEIASMRPGNYTRGDIGFCRFWHGFGYCFNEARELHPGRRENLRITTRALYASMRPGNYTRGDDKCRKRA